MRAAISDPRGGQIRTETTGWHPHRTRQTRNASNGVSRESTYGVSHVAHTFLGNVLRSGVTAEVLHWVNTAKMGATSASNAHRLAPKVVFTEAT